jgi:DNA/RNA endonuclease YhcR with UshA esterase domain
MKLTDPTCYRLFEASQESPELDRVVEIIARHKRNRTYDRKKTVKMVERYVVETEAIKLANETGSCWFRMFPEPARVLVAESVVKGWEREIDPPTQINS